MIQQVNLFEHMSPSNHRRISASLLAKILILFIIALALVYAALIWRGASFKQQLINTEQLQKQALKKIGTLSGSLSPDQKKVLETDTQALQDKITEKNKILDIIKQQHDINFTGFSQYLTAFANTITPDTWITQAELENGGLDIILIGQSLNSDSVLTFTNALNKNKLFKRRHLEFKIQKLEKVTDETTHKVWFDFTIIDHEVGNRNER
jgi:type II secretory pathway pseudopilin PulG